MQRFNYLALLPILCCSGIGLANSPSSEGQSNEVTLGDSSLTSGIPGIGLLTDNELDRWLDNSANHVPLKVSLPKGLDAASANIFIPEDNPMTRAKIELGRQLYFDERLSSDNTVSCASCHDPLQAFGAETRFGVGVRGQEGGRNSPVAYNRILSKAQFWDGRADSLEAQAVGPIANPIEMGNTHEASVARIASIPAYKKQFDVIFKDGVTIDNVGKAIATFERALVTGPMPYDAYDAIAKFEKLFADDLEFLDEEPELKAKYTALKQEAAKYPMSESAQRGMVLVRGKSELCGLSRRCELHRRAVPQFGSRHGSGETGPRSLRGHQSRQGSRRLQDTDAPQHRAVGSLHARRESKDARRSGGVVQQGRPQESSGSATK